MDLEIKAKCLTDKILSTVKEVDGEEYYCLPEILEQLGLKGGFNEKIIPITISGKIVWGFRFDSLNFLETVFIDKNSALALIQRFARNSINLNYNLDKEFSTKNEVKIFNAENFGL